MSERTRAVIAVDYAGQPADLDELRRICRMHELVLIEDAAHAIGATYTGRPIGSISDITTFSTHPVKHVATGEGGAVLTNSDEWARRMRRFRSHGIGVDARQRAERGTWFYEMTDLGYNYRQSDILCALGLSQLERLDENLARRRRIARTYADAFTEIDGARPLEIAGDRDSAWHLYVVMLEPEKLRVDRKTVFEALRAENIGANVHYIPVHYHPYYRALGYAKGICPVAERAYERMLTLPLFPTMTDADVGDVIEAVRKVLTAYAA